jgi:hypothetical protein
VLILHGFIGVSVNGFDAGRPIIEAGLTKLVFGALGFFPSVIALALVLMESDDFLGNAKDFRMYLAVGALLGAGIAALELVENISCCRGGMLGRRGETVGRRLPTGPLAAPAPDEASAQPG